MSDQGSENKRANGDVKGYLYFIFTLIVLVIISIAVLLNINASINDLSPSANLKRSGFMKTEITDAQGKAHSVEARFAVDFKDGTGSGINEKALFAEIKLSLDTLDYDRINQYGGLDYVKGHIMEHLENSGRFDTSVINGIYATDFQTDFALDTDSLPETNRVSEIFKNLFKGAK